MDYKKTHYSKNMFPVIAYYLTLLEYGYSKDDAYNLALKETQKAAYIQKGRNESIGKLPFAFNLFKLLIKNLMKKMYPKIGWETEWVSFNDKEIHFNFKTCIYVDMTRHYGCPELCTVFCKNDDVIFSGYAPKINFLRKGTIAEGASYCDFHFMNGKYGIEK